MKIPEQGSFFSDEPIREVNVHPIHLFSHQTFMMNDRLYQLVQLQFKLGVNETYDQVMLKKWLEKNCSLIASSEHTLNDSSIWRRWLPPQPEATRIFTPNCSGRLNEIAYIIFFGGVWKSERIDFRYQEIQSTDRFLVHRTAPRRVRSSSIARR
jgi:hypothetical protein